METSDGILAVVCHDAGGAENVSSYLRRHSRPYVAVLGGPALPIFERKLGALPTASLEEALERADWMLCGTSWQSDLELEAIDLARTLGKRSVAFLDHWVNYRERFIRADRECFPDEIWVGDEDALRIAEGLFGDRPIRQVENPYFMDVREELSAMASRATPKRGASVLYLCEPLREHALRQHGDERHWGYVEEEALTFFLENLAAIGAEVERIVVRKHPSEPDGKYDWAAELVPGKIVFSKGTSLTEDITASDVVIGCESMAMVVGLLAGKRVVSSIPPGGRACSLPQRAIESLRDLVSTVKR